MNNTEGKVIHIKDVIQSLSRLPRTVKLILELEKGLFFAILLVSMIAGVLPVVTVMVTQNIINMLIVGEQSFNQILRMVAVYVGLTIIMIILAVLLEFFQGRIQYKLQYKLNYKIMQKCSELSLADFENATIYDKINKICGEIAYKPYTIFVALIGLVTAIITLISSITLLLSWNVIAAVSLLVVPVISIIYFLRIGEKEFQMHWKRAKKERKTWYLSYILTHDFSYKEVCLYNFKDYILRKYWELSKLFIKQNDSILISRNIFTFIYELVVTVISSVIIIFATWSAYIGKILAGNVVSYMKSISLVESNSKAIMSNIYTLYNSALYMEMLFEFLDYKTKERAAIEEIEPIHSIQIEHLHFRYPTGEKEAVNDLSIELKAGEKLAIVGPNGSGKSTLIKIITGLYDINKGSIKINGKEVSDLQKYQKQMAVLFQDFVKYEGDIETLSDERIIEILDKVNASFLKQDGEYNLDRQLGVWFEGGTQLSQGQWQKIGLARAYTKNASVIILDEPNSALDPISEREVFDSFFNLTKDKIGVYISHKLNAAKLADKIIVVNEGTVVGVGKHEELLTSCETYRNLYEAENYSEE